MKNSNIKGEGKKVKKELKDTDAEKQIKDALKKVKKEEMESNDFISDGQKGDRLKDLDDNLEK